MHVPCLTCALNTFSYRKLLCKHSLLSLYELSTLVSMLSEHHHHPVSKCCNSCSNITGTNHASAVHAWWSTRRCWASNLDAVQQESLWHEMSWRHQLCPWQAHMHTWGQKTAYRHCLSSQYLSIDMLASCCCYFGYAHTTCILSSSGYWYEIWSDVGRTIHCKHMRSALGNTLYCPSFLKRMWANLIIIDTMFMHKYAEMIYIAMPDLKHTDLTDTASNTK